MKNQIYRVFAIFAVFFGLMVAGVQAQAPSKVEVEIPFEFSVGKATLKPGVYTIKRLSGNNLMLRRDDGKAAILHAPLTLTSSEAKPPNPNASRSRCAQSGKLRNKTPAKSHRDRVFYSISMRLKEILDVYRTNTRSMQPGLHQSG